VILRTIVLALALSCAMSDLFGQDSVRRTPPALRLPVPSAADSARNLAVLRAALDRCFTDRGYTPGGVSAKVVSLRTGATLYERGATTPLTPASTTKLFTTVAAFELMGNGASVHTTVKTDGLIDRDGNLDGNVYLIGTGDAILNVNDLEDLADQLTRMGIKRIRGNIYGDGSLFADSPERPVYSGDFEVVQGMPPVLALTVNQSTVAVIVTGLPNGRVVAQTIPAGDAFSIVTQPSRRRGRVRVGSTTLPNGHQQFVVSGNPGVNRTTTQYVTMTRPAIAAAGVFASRIRAGGITIDGTVADRITPASARILTVFRRPLSSFAYNINKRSDNHLAEHLFKMVGSVCGEQRQPAQRAKRAMLEVLDSLKVGRGGSVFNDGSGLSRRNKTSAATEVGMLVAASKRPWFPAFRSTLAIAGVDGTVRRRMAGTRAQGNVTAKTGSLRNVSALAGYVTSADGEPLVFSFISNGPGGSGYKVSENIACIALADFSYARPAGSGTPQPVTLADPLQDDAEDYAEDEAGYGAGAATRPPSASSVPPPSTTPPVTRPVTPPPVRRAITPARKAPAPPARRMSSSRRGSRKQTWRRSSKRGSKPSLRKQSRARKQPPKQRNRRRR